MLQQLIRQALSQKNMSMRQASLAAGMSEGWLKSILRTKEPKDPGIGAMIRLADFLEIDRLQLFEAVEIDFRGGPRDLQSIDAALRVFANMNPTERAAFIAANNAKRTR